MATIKQKRIAKLIVENVTLDKPLNGGQMLAKVGYAKSMHKAKVNDVLESEGVLETLTEYGFTEDNAKRVVGEIMLDPRQKGDTRINAAKEVFKVRGSYAPEKSQALNVNVELRKKDNPEINELLAEYKKKLKEKLTS